MPEKKAFYRGKEITGINERYVEGFGWVSNAEYERIMNTIDHQIWQKIRTYNISYKPCNGADSGQMDVEANDFNLNRVFGEHFQNRNGTEFVILKEFVCYALLQSLHQGTVDAYVVVYNLDRESKTWGQGYYFTDYEDALDTYRYKIEY